MGGWAIDKGKGSRARQGDCAHAANQGQYRAKSCSRAQLKSFADYQKANVGSVLAWEMKGIG
jgi:hypothetical protein